MDKTRLVTFSDGILAIIITVMVLGFSIPKDGDLQQLIKLMPSFLSYTLSFIYIAIYWNNHHHLLETTKKVTTAIMWSNLHLLFWLSLIPFTTGWLGNAHQHFLPAFCYSFVLFMASIAFKFLLIAVRHSAEPHFKDILKDDRKINLSISFYAISMLGAYLHTGIAYLFLIAVTLFWVLPLKQIEKKFN